MNHRDHVNLISTGISTRGGLWADFGSGTGAFTLALAEIIGTTGVIYSVDRDKSALAAQQRAMQAQFPGATVHYLVADFTMRLDLPTLDGILMANSLHFLRDKSPTLALVHSYLRPGGRLILVEYNADRGNTWVPYPLSYRTWAQTAPLNGFTNTQQISSVPSRFLNEIYAAVSLKDE